MTKQEVLDSLYEWYKGVRAKIQDDLLDNDTKLSSSIVTISSSAIALTITFFEKLVANSNACSVLLLKTSWIFLTLAILTITFAYVANRKGLSKGMQILDVWQKKCGENLENGALKYPVLTNTYSKLSQILDAIGYTCFGIGVLLVLIFALRSF